MKSILKNISLSLVALTLIVLGLNGCKKEAADLETQTVVDNTIAENEFATVAPAVNERGIKSTGVRGCDNCNVAGRLAKNGSVLQTDTVMDGDTIIVDVPTDPNDSSRTMTIKFGPLANKKDGMLRTGKLIVKFNMPLRNPNVDITVTFDNYTCKGVKYNATVKIARSLSNNLVTFNVQVLNGVCSKDGTNGWTINYASNYTTIKEVNVDKIKFYGTANGTNRNGTKYTVKIDQATPLVKSFDCQWVASGIYELTTDKSTKSIDYGNGTCDNKAKLTVGKNSVDITLN